MDLNALSKEELIQLVKELREDNFDEEIFDRMVEESFQGAAYMESHGRIDYGYGCGIYGPV